MRCWLCFVFWWHRNYAALPHGLFTYVLRDESISFGLDCIDWHWVFFPSPHMTCPMLSSSSHGLGPL